MEVQLIAAGKVVLLVIAALLPIVNPLSSAPIFLAMTTWCSTDIRQALARRIAVNGFTLLLVSIFIGSHILAFFGISLPVVQVGGGLLVAATGWRLLDSRADQLTAADATPWAPDEIVRRAFYPLTLPLTVGPGSISVAITLGANTTRTHIDLWAFITAILIAITLIAVSIYVATGLPRTWPGYSVATARVFFFGCPPSSCFASVCRFSGTAPARCWAH